MNVAFFIISREKKIDRLFSIFGFVFPRVHYCGISCCLHTKMRVFNLFLVVKHYLFTQVIPVSIRPSFAPVFDFRAVT